MSWSWGPKETGQKENLLHIARRKTKWWKLKGFSWLIQCQTQPYPGNDVHFLPNICITVACISAVEIKKGKWNAWLMMCVRSLVKRSLEKPIPEDSGTAMTEKKLSGPLWQLWLWLHPTGRLPASASLPGKPSSHCQEPSTPPAPRKLESGIHETTPVQSSLRLWWNKS